MPVASAPSGGLLAALRRGAAVSLASPHPAPRLERLAAAAQRHRAVAQVAERVAVLPHLLDLRAAAVDDDRLKRDEDILGMVLQNRRVEV